VRRKTLTQSVSQSKPVHSLGTDENLSYRPSSAASIHVFLALLPLSIIVQLVKLSTSDFRL